MTEATSTVLEEARQWIELGCYPIPVASKTKIPIGEEWQHQRLTLKDLPTKFQNGCNLGVLLSILPFPLVDLDIDSKEAVIISNGKVLSGRPDTERVFGRPGKPQSHFLYQLSEEFPSQKWEDPDTRKTIVELRGQSPEEGTPQHTVMPGSTHETGELIRWHVKASFGKTDIEDLKKFCSKLAAASLLYKHFHTIEQWHAPTLALSGMLAVGGWSKEAILEFVHAVTLDDPHRRDRRVDAASTFDKVASGDLKVTQRKELESFVGKKVVKAVIKWLGLSTPSQSHLDMEYTDSGNADLVLEKHPDSILHCNEQQQWFIADQNKRWSYDRTNHIAELVEQVLRERFTEKINQRLTQKEIDKLTATLSYHKIMAAVRVLEIRQDIAVLADYFDSDPLMLGVENGVVDLMKRELTSLHHNLRVAKTAPVRFKHDAKCSRFLAYLEKVQPDPEVREFLQMLAGSCLCGRQPEQGIHFFHGGGANGKSVFIALLHAILGRDYAWEGSRALIYRPSRNTGERSTSNNELADLIGKRLVSSTERVGQNFNIELLKKLTGGDVIEGRQLYQRSINFKPTCKVIVVANEIPQLDSIDEAWRRRFVLTPWSVTIPEKERFRPMERYVEYLLEDEERSGFLNWLLEGFFNFAASDWRLVLPKAILDATKDYLSDQQIVERFKNAWLEKEDTPAQPEVFPFTTKRAHQAFVVWMDEDPRFVMKPRKFTTELMKLLGKDAFVRSTGNHYVIKTMRLNNTATAAIAIAEKIAMDKAVAKINRKESQPEPEQGESGVE